MQNKKKWFYLVKENRKISFEIDTKEEEFISIGSYNVHKRNLDRAILEIQKGLTSDYLFVDEIGGLELQKQGYYPVLKDVFNRVKNNIVVVNQKILSEVFKQYPKAQIYELINIEHCWIYPHYNVIKSKIDFLQN